MDEYLAFVNMRGMTGEERVQAAREAGTAPSQEKPRKRKVSAYSREFGRQYRAMRKKHPRMSHGAITKKAHAATRKIRKK